MRRNRALAIGALFITAVAAGNYLAGFLLHTLFPHDSDPLSWDTCIRYALSTDLPGFRGHTWKIWTAITIGFLLPLVLSFAILFSTRRTANRSTHGEARFATLADVRAKGMLSMSPEAIVVGKFKGQFICMPGQQYAILAAPTRSGKGVGIVIPNLLTYQGSMVVLDIKLENYGLTSGWRAKGGQKVYLFNPFAEDRRTHRWNPMTYVSDDPAFRVSDLMSIATMLYPDGSDENRFWISQARNAFMAFALYLFDQRVADAKAGVAAELRITPTLGMIYRLSSGTGRDMRETFEELAAAPFLSESGRVAFANLLSQEDRTFASILGMFKEPLNAWINPVLDAATSGDDFKLDEVRKKKMTIYIGIQPNKLAEARMIVNLFFSQLINVNTKELPRDNPELKYQCLLLMDEFTSIGRVEIIASSVAYMAGYNMRMLPIIQSMAQLDAVYGKDESRTLITNHALQVVFAPREQRDASDYSEMLGYTTVSRESVTHGKRGDVSRNRSEERRALMLPQELKAMGDKKEVIFYEGIEFPIMCEKIRYYEDKYFAQRLLPRVDVPPLIFDRFQ